MLAGVAGLAGAVGGAAAARAAAHCGEHGFGVPAARLAALARGFNLTGWLDAPAPRRPDFTLLARLRQRGFTHIRLPVRPEFLIDELGGAEQAARTEAELDFALARLLAMDYAVSLDMHPGRRFGTLHVAEPERAFVLLVAAWRRLARKLAPLAPDRLFLETLNEPSVPAAVWNTQGPALAAAIRAAAPGHTLIYGTANFQRIDALPAHAPLADRNVVYAVHYYDPMVFTHQGLTWSDDPLGDLAGVPFPARASDPRIAQLHRELLARGRDAAAALLARELRAPWTEARVADAVGAAGAWSRRERAPVILNEFGVLAWKAPPEDRARWLRTVRSAAEDHCVGWAHWEYADAFGFVRREGGREIVDEAVLAALLGPCARQAL